MAKKNIEVIQNEKILVAANVMAEAIVDISKAMKALSSTRLSRQAIIALIHDKTGHYKSTIGSVIENLESLESTWLK